MPIIYDGKKYYRTAEVCRMAGISKNTLLRWIREKTFVDVKTRDRRGWRLFTKDDLDRLTAEVHKVTSTAD